MQTHERWGVRRCRDDNSATAILGPEDALDEFLHFAASLADEADDDHVRIGVAGHHPEQHALADAASGEEADALAASDGEERVDRANTHVQRLGDRLAQERVDLLSGE